MKPLVAIIIVNWNGLEDTRDCLNSLKKIDYKNFYLIIVDNHSKIDEALILHKEYKNSFRLKTIRTKKNYGYDEGCNIGIRYAQEKFQPDYFLIMNNDVVVSPKFLSFLVSALDYDKKRGMASPQILYYNKNEGWWAGIIKINKITGKPKWYVSNKTAETDMVTGCCMLVKSNVIKRVGLLNPKFFLSGLDTLEYSLRAKKEGFKLFYVPKSKVWHKFGKSARRLNPFRYLRYELVGAFTFISFLKPYQIPFYLIDFSFNFLKARLKNLMTIVFNRKKRKIFILGLKSSFK